MKLKVKVAFLWGLLFFGLFCENEAKRLKFKFKSSRPKVKLNNQGSKSNSNLFENAWYSPSHSYPSSNSYHSLYSTNNFHYKDTYSSHFAKPVNYYRSSKNTLAYGKTFGNAGLGINTYISNNYYKKHRDSSSSDFLTNAMFYNVGMRHGAHHTNDYHRYWNEKQDQMWRATTQGPYFENKIPTEDDKVLPASAVIGAATAFGLASLLPLKVPISKPLMYCGKTELMQALIRIENDAIYECKNEKFVQLFPQNPKNSTNLENSIIKEYKNIDENKENSTNNSVIYFGEKTMLCEEEKYEGIFCKNGILLSSDEIFCNSTVIFQPTNSNKTIDILNCYKGEFPENQSSFIPTTSTEAPINTEKSLSVSAQMHIFMLKLLGKHEVLEKKDKEIFIPKVESLWIPVALEILPETTTEATTTTTTPESPFDWIKTIRTPELCYNQFYLTCYKNKKVLKMISFKCK